MRQSDDRPVNVGKNMIREVFYILLRNLDNYYLGARSQQWDLCEK